MATGQCRGFNTWAQEAEYYHSLSPERKRHHRLEGHAYMVSLRPENSNKTPEEIWLLAEEEVCKTDIEVRIAKAVRGSLARLAKADVSNIGDNTSLPPNADLLRQLYGMVMIETNQSSSIVTGNSRTVGALIAELCANHLKNKRP